MVSSASSRHSRRIPLSFNQIIRPFKAHGIGYAEPVRQIDFAWPLPRHIAVEVQAQRLEIVIPVNEPRLVDIDTIWLSLTGGGAPPHEVPEHSASSLLGSDDLPACSDESGNNIDRCGCVQNISSAKAHRIGGAHAPSAVLRHWLGQRNEFLQNTADKIAVGIV